MSWNDRLTGELSKLLPGATFRTASCRDWRSITFAGQQLTIIAELETAHGVEQAENFINTLPDREFALPGAIVADIAVVNVTNHGESLCLEIDAVVLDE